MTEQTVPIKLATSQPKPRQSFGDRLKRAFDIVVALLGLIFLSPFFLLISFWIRRDSPGPVLYWGKRAGKNGREFNILKFRTMYENPDSYNGLKVTAKGDSRITPLGKWLRDTKLNELPQLWNVLKGEMSLVGPRPEDIDIMDEWPAEAREEILSMAPGITSPASVLYRDEERLLTKGPVMGTYFDVVLPSKVRLDQLYVRNHSFWLDLDVLLWTFLLLLPRIGSYQPPEERLFWGPVSRFVRRYVSWFTLDIVITFGAFGIVGVIWRSFGPFDVGWINAIGLACLFAMIFSFIGAIFGVHRVEWAKAVAADVFDLMPPVFLAALAVYFINYGLRAFPSAMMIVGSIAAFVGFVFARYRSRIFTGFASYLLRMRDVSHVARERVLIVGGGDAGQFAAWMLNSRGASAFYVVGFVDDDLYKQGIRIRGINVLGRRKDILKIVEKKDVGIIVFAIHNISADERQKLIEICDSTPAQVVMLPDFLGSLNAVTLDLAKAPDSACQESGEELDFSISQLECWLESLEKSASQGDLTTVLADIRLYRKWVKDQAKLQETV